MRRTIEHEELVAVGFHSYLFDSGGADWGDGLHLWNEYLEGRLATISVMSGYTQPLLMMRFTLSYSVS